MAERKIKSARLLDRAFDDNELKPFEKLVFLVMCRRGNQSKRCYMSISRLMLETNASRSSISRALRSLRLSGRIALKGRRGRSGVNEYFLQPLCPSDPIAKSERAPKKGQDDAQNPNLNLNSNPLRPVDSMVISQRRGRVSKVGDLAKHLSIHGSSMPNYD